MLQGSLVREIVSNPDGDALTLPEAANALGESVAHVRALAMCGELRAVLSESGVPQTISRASVILRLTGGRRRAIEGIGAMRRIG
jgi:hypothetical protein